MKKVLIAGGSGLVGSRLIQLLDRDKYDLFILSRKKKASTTVQYMSWNPVEGEIDLEGISPDIIINLAGAGIADKKWTEQRKKELIDSRVESTQVFLDLIEQKKIKPSVYISASAVGIYGDRGEEKLTEDSTIGSLDSFLVECCQLWENKVVEISKHIENTSMLRIGIVLSSKGGALPKMLTPVKMGMAGYFGNGSQYMPWIHIDDLCEAIKFLINNHKDLKGVFNGVNPNPVTQRDFMKVLKMVYRSWALLVPTPAAILKTAMGEMSSILLNSNRVFPQRLIEAGFQFRFSDLESAIRDINMRKV
jgi:uncharacterized protein (TIGR01777 family)